MNRSKFICGISVLICLALLMAGAPRSSGQEPEESAVKLSKRLIGDYGYWSRTQDPPYGAEQIPFSKLTHINHAGVGFDANANLVVPDGFLEPRLIDKAHDSGVKVLLLLGGDFTVFETTPALLDTLIANLHKFIVKHGYDGVDIDWEYPSSALDESTFHSLMLKLRTAFPSPYVLSADVPPWEATGYDFPDTKFLVDYYNLMTYDCAGPWTDSAQLNSPIFLDPNNPEQYNCDPGGSIKDATDLFVKDLTIPKTKLNMGTPFYGYFYHDVNALWGFCANEDCSDSVDYLNYGTDFKPLINKKGWRTYYDPYALVPYMIREDGGPGFITYDDAFSTFYRVWYTDWQRGLGGTFIWELDADYDGQSQDLLDAAYNATKPQTK